MSDTDLESRLRRALAARAAAVTSQNLRPITERRSLTARWWLPLSAGIAAAAVSILAFALLRPGPAADAPPIMPGSSASPAASPSPSPTSTLPPTISASPASPQPTSSAEPASASATSPVPTAR
jgi:uncharacterized membrane protein